MIDAEARAVIHRARARRVYRRLAFRFLGWACVAACLYLALTARP